MLTENERRIVALLMKNRVTSFHTDQQPRYNTIPFLREELQIADMHRNQFRPSVYKQTLEKIAASKEARLRPQRNFDFAVYVLACHKPEWFLDMSDPMFIDINELLNKLKDFDNDVTREFLPLFAELLDTWNMGEIDEIKQRVERFLFTRFGKLTLDEEEAIKRLGLMILV
jgi:hypothetical protein